MSSIKHFIEAMINPFAIFIFLFAVALFRLYRQNTQRTLFYQFFSLWVLLLIISTGWLPYALTQYLEKQTPPVSRADPSIQWVVVLSGGQSDYDRLPPHMVLYSASLKRLLEGVRLAQSLPAASLVLSGGSFNQQTSEAEHLQGVLKLLAKTQGQVMLEKASLNTAEQAQALKLVLANHPFYLVTSATHMPRAVQSFRDQGLNPIPAPTDFTIYWEDERWEKFYLPHAQNMVYLTIALHEIWGLLWYRIQPAR